VVHHHLSHIGLAQAAAETKEVSRCRKACTLAHISAHVVSTGPMLAPTQLGDADSGFGVNDDFDIPLTQAAAHATAPKSDFMRAVLLENPFASVHLF